MSQYSDKLKESFENPLNQQLLQMDLANAELDEQEPVIRNWPIQKKRITTVIIRPMQKWAADLKRITKPLNLKKYKREKKRFSRYKNITWSNWQGFWLRFKLTFLWTMNVIRILMILAFFIGAALLVVLLGIKAVKFIGSMFN
jgi:hypothetical protein